jgi:hypothetical protein
VEFLIEIFWEAKVAETHEGGFFTASKPEGSGTLNSQTGSSTSTEKAQMDCHPPT